MAFVIGTPSGSYGSMPRYGSLTAASPCGTPSQMNQYMTSLEERERSGAKSSWKGETLATSMPDSNLLKRKSKMDALHTRTKEGQALRLRLLSVLVSRHEIYRIDNIVPNPFDTTVLKCNLPRKSCIVHLQKHTLTLFGCAPNNTTSVPSPGACTHPNYSRDLESHIALILSSWGRCTHPHVCIP